MKPARQKQTFKEIYDSLGRPTPPKKAWIEEIAALTCKGTQSVRYWLSGIQKPDALTQRVISEHLGIPVEELFPVPVKPEKE